MMMMTVMLMHNKIFFIWFLNMKLSMGAAASKLHIAELKKLPPNIFNCLSHLAQIVYFEDSNLLSKLEKIQDHSDLFEPVETKKNDFSLLDLTKLDERLVNAKSLNRETSSLSSYLLKNPADIVRDRWYVLLHHFGDMHFIPVTWIKVFDVIHDPNKRRSLSPPSSGSESLERILRLSPSLFKQLLVYNPHLQTVDRYTTEGYLNMFCAFKNGQLYLIYTPHHFFSSHLLSEAMNSPHTKVYYPPETINVDRISTILRSFLPKQVQTYLVDQ